LTGFFIIILALLIFGACTPAYQRFSAHRLGPFDTITTFIGYAENEEAFAHYADIVFGRLEELHRYYDIFNAYDGINNLYTINSRAGIAPVAVSQDIIDLLLVAREAYEITEGMTNAAMGAVLRIWHEYRTYGIANPDYAALPSWEILAQAAELMDMSHVIIDEAGGTVFLEAYGMSLDVGSIAKGFAAGLAAEAAAEAGMEAMLLSAGGHVVAIGTPPGRDAWNIGIANPDRTTPGAPQTVDTLRATDVAVSTSSASLRYFTVDDGYLGHIIDPTTLHPPQRFAQVVVIHPVSWMADALSTALFILPLEEGQAMARQAGADALWIDIYNNWTYTAGYEIMSAE
jgi:thiamine biosynthesis lipoprotein